MQGTNDNTSIFVLLRTVYTLPVVVCLFVFPFPTAHPIGLAGCQLSSLPLSSVLKIEETTETSNHGFPSERVISSTLSTTVHNV